VKLSLVDQMCVAPRLPVTNISTLFTQGMTNPRVKSA